MGSISDCDFHLIDLFLLLADQVVEDQTGMFLAG
jgi:hypothetical protein